MSCSPQILQSKIPSSDFGLPASDFRLRSSLSLRSLGEGGRLLLATEVLT